MFPLSARVRNLDPDHEIHVAAFVTHQGAAVAELRPWDGPAEANRLPPGITHFKAGHLQLNGPVRYTSNEDEKLVVAFLRIDMRDATGTIHVRKATSIKPLIAASSEKGISHLALPTGDFAKVMLQMIGVEEDTQPDQPAENEELFSLLTLIKLGSPTTAAEEELIARISLSAPDLPLAYDGIMLLPLVLQPKGDGHVVVHLDQSKAPALTIPVTGSKGAEVFDLDRPEPKAAASDTAPSPLPDLDIEVDPSAIPRGRQVRKRFRVHHGPAPAGAEIYIILQPSIRSEGVIFGRDSKGRTLRAQMSAYNMNLLACRSELAASLMRIRQSPITIKLPLMYVPILEAGRLGAVRNPGDGVVEGTIDFAAPPLADWYDTLEATPMLMSWNESDGKLCAQIRFDPEQGVSIPLINP